MMWGVELGRVLFRSEEGRLPGGPGMGVSKIVAGARPAELADNDALTRMGAAQLVVLGHGPVDRLVCPHALPVGQDMGGNEINRGGKLGVIAPVRPDLTGRDCHRAAALDPLPDGDLPLDAPL